MNIFLQKKIVIGLCSFSLIFTAEQLSITPSESGPSLSVGGDFEDWQDLGEAKDIRQPVAIERVLKQERAVVATSFLSRWFYGEAAPVTTGSGKEKEKEMQVRVAALLLRIPDDKRGKVVDRLERIVAGQQGDGDEVLALLLEDESVKADDGDSEQRDFDIPVQKESSDSANSAGLAGEGEVLPPSLDCSVSEKSESGDEEELSLAQVFKSEWHAFWTEIKDFAGWSQSSRAPKEKND